MFSCLGSRGVSLMPLMGAMLMVLGLVACGTAGRSYVKSAMQETLELAIRPDTSKMFTYRLKWPEEQIPSTVRIDRGAGYSRATEPSGIDVGRGTYERLQANAAYVVARAGYCREGFFELDRRVSRYEMWVRGECKESASEADQARFGAAKTLTPKAWAKPF
jgi:hypothetical protein